MSKSYQYQFDLIISKVFMEIPFACSVELWWRKGNKKIITKNRIELTGRQKFFQVNEKLSMITVCNIQSGLFSQKQSVINIVVMTLNNPNKSGGFYNLELTDVLKGFDYMNPTSKNYEVPIQGCPTKNGKICFNMSAKYIGEATGNHSFYEEKSSFQTTKRISNDITFRADDNTMDFSFQQTTGRQNKHNYYDHRQPQNLPIQPLYPSNKIMGETAYFDKEQLNKVQNQTFHQMLEIKRKLDQKNTQYAKLINEFNKLQSHNMELSDKIKHIDNESKHKDIRLMNEINKINNQLEKERKQAHDNKSKSHKYKEELNQANKKLEDLQNELFRKQSQLISIENLMSSKIKESIGTIEKLNEMNSMLNTELRNSNDRIKAFQMQTVMSQGRLLKQKELFETRIKDLEAKLKEKNDVIDIVRKQFQTFEHQKNELAKKCKENENQKAQLTQNITKIVGQTQSNQHYFNTRLQEIQNQFQAQQKQAELEIKELNIKIKALEQLSAKQQAQINEKELVLQKARQYVAYKQQEIVKRDEFIIKAKQYIKQKENEFLECLESLTQQKQLNTTLQRTVEQTQIALQASTEKINVLQSQITQVGKHTTTTQSEQISALKQQLASKQKFLEQYLIQSSTSIGRIEELEELLFQKDKQIMELRDYLAAADKDERSRQNQSKARMEQILKQNAQYQIESNIYKSQIRNFHEQVDRNNRNLLKMQDTQKNLIAQLERNKEKVLYLERQLHLKSNATYP